MILKATVDEVVVENDRAVGVRYNGNLLRAREAVVSSGLRTFAFQSAWLSLEEG